MKKGDWGPIKRGNIDDFQIPPSVIMAGCRRRRVAVYLLRGEVADRFSKGSKRGKKVYSMSTSENLLPPREEEDSQRRIVKN